jgi:hypothetical protein
MSNNNETLYNYGQALGFMRKGYRVARISWPEICGCVYQKGYPEGVPCNKQTAQAWNITEGSLFRCNPYLQKRNEDDTYSMWQPTIEDLLADDWVIRYDY